MPLEIRGAHFLIRSAQLVRGTRLEYASAVNVTLLAFIAAAPLMVGARRRCFRSISLPSPASTALSSKPTARRGCGRTMEQTDRRTDGRTIVS